MGSEGGRNDSMKNNARKYHILFAILVMVFIFIQSALPGDLSGRESNLIVQFLAERFSLDPLAVSFAVRKTGHFLEYLILGCSLVPVMRNHRMGSVLAWVIGSVYAVTDEIHQLFVPGRSCEIRDMCIDSCGVLVGVVIGLLLCKLRYNKVKEK